jgi:hypothetical protein
MDVAAQEEPLLLMDLAAQQEPLDVPVLQRHVLHLDQQNRGLHLDVPGQQKPVLGLYTRGLGCTVHMYMSRFQDPVLSLDVSKPQGPELHLEVSGKQEPVLVWTFLPRRCLNYAWMCLENITCAGLDTYTPEAP